MIIKQFFITVLAVTMLLAPVQSVEAIGLKTKLFVGAVALTTLGYFAYCWLSQNDHGGGKRGNMGGIPIDDSAETTFLNCGYLYFADRVLTLCSKHEDYVTNNGQKKQIEDLFKDFHNVSNKVGWVPTFNFDPTTTRVKEVSKDTHETVLRIIDEGCALLVALIEQKGIVFASKYNYSEWTVQRKNNDSFAFKSLNVDGIWVTCKTEYGYEKTYDIFEEE